MWGRSICAVALVLLCLSAASGAASRELGSLQGLVASTPDNTLCNENLSLTVNAPDQTAFSGDQRILQKLLANVRAMLSFECAGQTMPESLLVRGEARGLIVYHGKAEAAGRWILQDADQAEAGPSIAAAPSPAENGAVPSAAEAAARCDLLAAHPDDPGKPAAVAGVADADIDPEAALEACIAAVDVNPGDSRLVFQLGRVLMLGGQDELARDFLEDAKSGGSAAAPAYLAQLEGDPAERSGSGRSVETPPSTKSGPLCDALAAHPKDREKPAGVQGVKDSNLDPTAAFEACAAAVAAEPENSRYRFELGRALLHMDGMEDEAATQLQMAADAGYRIASTYLTTQATNAATAAPVVEAPPTLRSSGGFDTSGYRQPNLMAGFFLKDFRRVKGGTGGEISFYIMHLVGTANNYCPDVDPRIANSIAQSEFGDALTNQDAMVQLGLQSLMNMVQNLANPTELMRNTMNDAVWERDARADMTTFLKRYQCGKDVNRLLGNAAAYYASLR